MAPSFAISDATTADDLRAWNELWARIRPSMRLTFEEFLDDEGWLGDHERVRWLVTVSGELAAIGGVNPEVFVPTSDAASAVILVAEPWCGRGIGSELYTRASEWARERGFTALRLIQLEGESLGHSFWSARGFRCVERLIEVAVAPHTIHVPDAPLPEGTRIVTLQERTELARDCWQIIDETMRDIPSHEQEELPPWEEQGERWLASPRIRHDAVFIAMDGDEAVGIAQLEFSAAQPGIAWHGYTGVRRPWRGRGVATALKIASIEWCRRNGVMQLRTDNDERNAPMRGINRKLGYERIPSHELWRGPLAPPGQR